KTKKQQKKLNVNFAELKAGGFIKQNKKDLFTVRLRIPGGRMPVNRLKKIIKIAQKYGKADFVHLTTRQSLEIISVDICDFNRLKKELKKIGQETASCGPRVRVATGCGGCEYNARGIIDAQKLASEVDKKFFGIPTVHGKFKISFAGCPSDCTRAKGADIGFVGEIEPEWAEKKCIGCGLCAKACLEGAIVSDGKTGKPNYDYSKCIFCGDCVKVCPTSAWYSGRIGCGIYVGGRWGRHPRMADLITHLFPVKNIIPIIKRTIDWFIKNGKIRERIGNTIDRVGLKKYKNDMKEFAE
ncbi:MAG: 4Fe-4S binding protein, partial [Elusimicrobiota bacterium]|nr:4Fe-4S binding protein [Elusimicrobiota bacterium]